MASHLQQGEGGRGQLQQLHGQLQHAGGRWWRPTAATTWPTAAGGQWWRQTAATTWPTAAGGRWWRPTAATQWPANCSREKVETSQIPQFCGYRRGLIQHGGKIFFSQGGGLQKLNQGEGNFVDSGYGLDRLVRKIFFFFHKWCFGKKILKNEIF